MRKPSAFKTILRNAMAKRGMSEDQGAEVIGCSQPCLNRWINGWTTPRIANLRGISKLTGLSVEELVELYERETAKREPAK
jgi:ribosome-binding protein aMBF1 (putative translation factor)